MKIHSAQGAAELMRSVRVYWASLIRCSLILVFVFVTGSNVQSQENRDDAWAAALWAMLFPDRTTDLERGRLIASALATASDNEQALMLVSFGDVDRGWNENLRGLLEKAATEVSAANSTKAESPANSSLDHLIDALRNRAKTPFRVQCYQAAVKRNPECVEAWLRLAAVSEGDDFTTAHDQLKKLQPKNSMNMYLLAFEGYRKNNDLDAIRAIEAGNKLPDFWWPETPLPARTSFLTFSDEPDTLRLGLVGKPIPKAAFKYFVEIVTQNDEFPAAFFRLRQALYPNDDQGVDTAIRRALAVRAMGLKMISGEPPCRTATILGVGNALSGSRIFQELGGQEKLNEEDLKRYLSEASALDKFSRELRKISRRPPLSDSQLLSLLTGERDIIEEELKHIEKLRNANAAVFFRSRANNECQ